MPDLNEQVLPQPVAPTQPEQQLAPPQQVDPQQAPIPNAGLRTPDPLANFVPPPDPDERLRDFTNVIYSEMAGKDDKHMIMVGSSVLNRLDSKRAKEFGSTLGEIIRNPNAYYAVSKNSKLYQQAVSGKFPDEMSERAYKRAMAIASGLLKGTIDRVKGQFYFTNKEIKKLKKQGKKVFDFKQVKNVGKTGRFNVFSY